MNGKHVYFVEFNGHTHYAGFDFMDLSYVGEPIKNKASRRFIRRFVRLCGFEDVRDYLASLPGHKKYEKMWTSCPMTSNGDDTSVDVTCDSNALQSHKFEFTFENEKSYDNELKDKSFRFLKWYINVILFGDNDMIPMLLITPTMEKIKQYYCNDIKSDSSDIELWFCEDWKDETEEHD